MYKPRIEVIFGNERIISPSGLDIVGAMLGKSDFPGTPRMCFKLLFPALFSRNAPVQKYVYRTAAKDRLSKFRRKKMLK